MNQCRFLSLFCMLILLMNCHLIASDKENDLPLVPWPKSVVMGSGAMTIGAAGRITFQDPSLEPLAKVLSDEIYLTRWLRLTVAAGKPQAGDIALVLDSVLLKEHYTLTVSKYAQISGGNYRAVAWGTVTLLQALQTKNGNVQVPQLTIDDEPAVEYRGVLIDTGRNYHPASTMKELITMCRLYKMNYMQLHLTDDQFFAFPSKIFPELPSVDKGVVKHFTYDELIDLVRYADERGVTLVPELETPGHSRILRKEKTFSRPGLGCVNMASEEAYDSFDKLIGEMCEVFKSSPFFHIGTDEAVTSGSGSTPEDKAYMKKHDLHDGHDLFNHHIVRLDQIVKKYGKKTIRWGGFNQDEKDHIQLPNDIVHMVWDVKGGGTVGSINHPVINAAWRPLYVVGTKAWLPEFLLDTWHVRLWQFHMNNNAGTTVAPGVPVFGAQMCAWEQPPEVELSSLRWRLPAMCEKIYNPNSGKKYTEFNQRFVITNCLLDRMFTPVQCDVDGLIGPLSDRAFTNTATFTLSGVPGSAIHYTIDGTDPTASSALYTKPFTVNVKDVPLEGFFWSRPHGRYLRTTPRLHVKTVSYSADGSLIGQVHDNFYHAIAPLVTAQIYYSPRMFDNTKRDWLTAHDWEKMGMKPDKIAIWPDLVFATPLASQDAVCVPFCSGVITKGTINIPTDGDYAFAYVDNGGEVYIDGKMVTKSDSGQLDVTKLSAGHHSIEVRYAYPGMFHWGTQSLVYTKLNDGQKIEDLFAPAKDKAAKWKVPKEIKGIKKGEGQWKDHATLLIPLDNKIVTPYLTN